MNDKIKSNQQDLISRHAKLYRRWNNDKLLCIICGEREGNSRDHLPPKGLYPQTESAENPNFLTYRACQECNGGSSDSDYLFGVYLALYLNQDAYLNYEEPEDPDLLALHTEAIERLSSTKKGDHRQKLLARHINYNKEHQAYGLNPDKLEIHATLVKIVKAIYWLQTDGEILQKYNQGWWIFPRMAPTT